MKFQTSNFQANFNDWWLRCIFWDFSHTNVYTLRPRQNGRRFADDTFKRIFLNESVGISIKISLKFVQKGPINNNPALVQIMAWCRSGDKPLSEPMMNSLLTHKCVTRPKWVNGSGGKSELGLRCVCVCVNSEFVSVSNITENPWTNFF